jgi:twinkle protein
VFSGEMTPEYLLKRMTKQATGCDRPTPAYIDAVDEWLRDRCFIFNQMGSATIKRLLEVFAYAHKRYGVTHAVIDSLMMTDVPEDGPGAMTAQKEAIRALCDFSKRSGCHTHLVAHPRKGKDESTGPGKMDVAGSGKITDGADNVFTVWRAQKDEAEEYDPEKPDAKLELKKQRNGDVQNYSQWLWFNKGAMQFRAQKRALQTLAYVPFTAQPAGVQA